MRVSMFARCLTWVLVKLLYASTFAHSIVTVRVCVYMCQLNVFGRNLKRISKTYESYSWHSPFTLVYERSSGPILVFVQKHTHKKKLHNDIQSWRMLFDSMFSVIYLHRFKKSIFFVWLIRCFVSWIKWIHFECVFSLRKLSDACNACHVFGEPVPCK